MGSPVHGKNKFSAFSISSSGYRKRTSQWSLAPNFFLKGPHLLNFLAPQILRPDLLKRISFRHVQISFRPRHIPTGEIHEPRARPPTVPETGLGVVRVDEVATRVIPTGFRVGVVGEVVDAEDVGSWKGEVSQKEAPRLDGGCNSVEVSLRRGRVAVWKGG